MMKISIVIPVYNNSETLFETFDRICVEHNKNFHNLQLEVLFVNDGSTDESWNILKDLKFKYPQIVRCLQLSRNFGQLGALYAGFKLSTGDAVISLSADLQDPIELISQMVFDWQNDSEIVICHRENREDGSFRKFTSKIAYALSRVTYKELPEGGFDYWLMSRRVCDKLVSLSGRHNFIQGYLVSLGYRKTFHSYVRKERVHGKSGYTFGAKTKVLIDFLVDTSYFPIRIMSLIGFLFTASGFIYSISICISWYMGTTPFAGWAPIMILLLVIGGLIMIMLGIIGEYIWRLYDNQRAFPLYLVDSEL